MKSFKFRAVLTGVVITGTLLFASPAWATFPGTNGRITFAALPTPNAPGKQIYTIQPNGTGLTDLTGNQNGCEAAPSFTPDGTRIVFERFDDNTNVDAIWSMNLSGGDRHQITTGTGSGVTNPEVSPDGQWIVYRLQSKSTTTFGLFKIRPDGTQRTLIAQLPFAPRFIDWGTHH